MPWQLRNAVEFGDYKLSNRASGVLSLRAEVFDITKAEYFHGFKYWLPDSELRDQLIKPNKNLSIKFDDSSSNKLAWWNRHDKHYGYVLSRMNLNSIKTDYLIEEESLRVFKENFFSNIPISFLFFYKSLFIDFNSSFIYKVITWLLPILFIFLLFYRTLISRFYLYFFFALPSFYHIGIYSFFTYYEARYNMLIIPILWLSIFIGFIKKNVKQK